LYLDTAPARRLSQELRHPGAGTDLDGLEARLVELRRNRDFRRARKGTGPTYAKGRTRAEVLAARDAVMLALDDFQVRADEELAALLHAELLECTHEYEGFKRREGALDFLDLLLRARNLVRDDSLVRRHFQQRFKRIFVDEFQDTDPLQAELLLLLSAHDSDEARWEQVTPLPGKLFIVGDPKQSIYRFRRADVDVYRRVCDQLERAGGRRVELRKSFRGVPALQRFVNAAFARVMDGHPDELQARYVALEPERADASTQPAVVALPIPNPYGARFVSPREIDRSLPDAIAAYVEWLVKRSGWTVTERRRPTARVRVEPRHVCVLFRRFVSYGEDVTRKYVEALEARGIHHLLVGGRTFHNREEIETLRAALMAIEWPDDRLSVFATLRGALFAIGDEELLEYQRAGGRFHPFGLPASLPARFAPIQEALDLLGTLHRHRNRKPVADTISTLLSRTRAHVGFVLRPAGEQVLANVLHVAELARQYEADGGMSFRGFVDTLAEEAAGAAAEAPILEEGSDGVRLMTVHKAKGLEFPVVILADITARLTPFEAGRFIDSRRGLCALRIGGWSPRDLNEHRDLELRREQREGERVAYVAATRARDLLVVPAVGDGPYNEGWISPLNAALYPPEERRRVSTAATGCPTFRSRDTVLNRPGGDPARTFTVSPGEHHFANPEGGYSVVWWSPEPEVLPLGAQPLLGLRRDDLIVKDVAPTVLRSYLDAYTAWRLSRQAAIQEASTPSVSVATATQIAALGDAPDVSTDFSVTVEEVDDIGSRPHGLRFGMLVHAVLADVPLSEQPDAQRDAVSRLAVSHGRILGAEDIEIDAARNLALHVLAHPLLRAAAAAAEHGRCHREAQVTCVRDDGTLVEGTVDLAFDDGEGFVVVDFKTDRPDPDRRQRYERQVAWYAASLARATGRRARGVLMIV
jgi:ATP-dependent exoDNAse (exonuclease V) beta subunit